MADQGVVIQPKDGDCLITFGHIAAMPHPGAFGVIVTCDAETIAALSEWRVTTELRWIIEVVARIERNYR